MALQAYLKEKREMVNRALDACLPEEEGPASRLVSAMRYSLFAGGKRLRPILCMAGAEAVGGDPALVLPAACALEFIHTYSLIHDDLPVMDDDDLRRGKPTSHKVFGDALALLAGDGLLTEAFSLLSSPRLSERVAPQLVLRVIGLISGAAGHRGMVAGQAVDIQFEGKPADAALLEFLHTHKTGALITAAVVSGAMLAGADAARVRAMTDYGRKIGLAFQISDDILDIEGDTATLGKKTGTDEEKKKITYPSLMGLDRSGEIRSRLVTEAVNALKSFDHRADPLREIARYIVERKK